MNFHKIVQVLEERSDMSELGGLGSGVNLTEEHSGWLYKQSRGAFKKWQKRYFHVAFGMMSYYESDPKTHSGKPLQPKDSFPLVEVVLEMPVPGTYERDFVFHLRPKISKKRSVYILAAGSKIEFEQWLKSLRGFETHGITSASAISDSVPNDIQFGSKLQEHKDYKLLHKFMIRSSTASNLNLQGEEMTYHCKVKESANELNFFLITNRRLILVEKGKLILALSIFDLSDVWTMKDKATSISYPSILMIRTFGGQEYQITYMTADHAKFFLQLLSRKILDRQNYPYLSMRDDAKTCTNRNNINYGHDYNLSYYIVPYSNQAIFGPHFLNEACQPNIERNQPHCSSLVLSVQPVFSVMHSHVVTENELVLSTLKESKNSTQKWRYSPDAAKLGLHLIRLDTNEKKTKKGEDNNNNIIIQTVELYEYQRLCTITGWTGAMFPSDPVPWCTVNKHTIVMTKDNVDEIPMHSFGCRWNGPWSIDSNLLTSDEHGWSYTNKQGTELTKMKDDECYHSHLQIGDIIRRRKWKKELRIPSQKQETNVGSIAPHWAQRQMWGLLNKKNDIMTGSIHIIPNYGDNMTLNMYKYASLAPVYGTTIASQQHIMTDGMLCSIRKNMIRKKKQVTFQWSLKSERDLLLEYTIAPFWNKIDVYCRKIQAELKYATEYSDGRPPSFWKIPVNDITCKRIYPSPEFKINNNHHIEIYRLNEEYKPTEYSDIVSFGDVVFNDKTNKNNKIEFTVSSNHIGFCEVDDFDLELKLYVEDNQKIFLWRPIPMKPDTHEPLGLVCTLTADVPNPANFPRLRCVPKELLLPVPASLAFIDLHRIPSIQNNTDGISLWTTPTGTFDASDFQCDTNNTIHTNVLPPGPYFHLACTNDITYKSLVAGAEGLLQEMFKILKDIVEPKMEEQMTAFNAQNSIAKKKEDEKSEEIQIQRQRALTQLEDNYSSRNKNNNNHHNHNKKKKHSIIDDGDVLTYDQSSDDDFNAKITHKDGKEEDMLVDFNSDSDDDDDDDDKMNNKKKVEPIVDDNSDDEEGEGLPPMGLDANTFHFAGRLIQYSSGLLVFLSEHARYASTMLSELITQFEEIQAKYHKYLHLQSAEEVRFAREQLDIPTFTSCDIKESRLSLQQYDKGNVDAVRDWFVWAVSSWPYVQLIPSEVSTKIKYTSLKIECLNLIADTSELDVVDPDANRVLSNVESVALKRMEEFIDTRFAPATNMVKKVEENKDDMKDKAAKADRRKTIKQTQTFIADAGLDELGFIMEEDSDYISESDEEWGAASGNNKDNNNNEKKTNVISWKDNKERFQMEIKDENETQEYELSLNNMLLFLSHTIRDIFIMYDIVLSEYIDIPGLQESLLLEEKNDKYKLPLSSKFLLQHTVDMYHKQIQKTFWIRVQPRKLSNEALLRVYNWLFNFKDIYEILKNNNLNLHDTTVSAFIVNMTSHVVTAYMQKVKQSLFNWLAVTFQNELQNKQVDYENGYYTTTVPQDIFFNLHTVFENCITAHKLRGHFAVKLLLMFADVLQYFITTRGNFFQREFFNAHIKYLSPGEKKKNNTTIEAKTWDIPSEIIHFKIDILGNERGSDYIMAQVNNVQRFRTMTQDLYDRCLEVAWEEEEEKEQQNQILSDSDTEEDDEDDMLLPAVSDESDTEFINLRKKELDEKKKVEDAIDPVLYIFNADPDKDKENLENVFDNLELGFNNLAIQCVDIFVEQFMAQGNVQAIMKQMFTTKWIYHDDLYEESNDASPILKELLVLLADAIGTFCHGTMQNSMHWRIIKTFLHYLIGYYLSQLANECLSETRKGKDNLKVKNFPLAVEKIKREVQMIKDFASEFSEVTSENVFNSYIQHILSVFPLMYSLFEADDEVYLAVYIPKIGEFVDNMIQCKFGCTARFPAWIDLNPAHILNGLLRFRGDREHTRERLLTFFFHEKGHIEIQRYQSASNSFVHSSVKIGEAIGVRKRTISLSKNKGMFSSKYFTLQKHDDIKEEDIPLTSMKIYVDKVRNCESIMQSITNPKLYCKIKLFDASTKKVLARSKTKSIKGSINPEWKEELIFNPTASHTWDALCVEVWHENVLTSNKGIGIAMLPKVVMNTHVALQVASENSDVKLIEYKMTLNLEKTTSSTSVRNKQRTRLSGCMMKDMSMISVKNEDKESKEPCVDIYISFININK